MSLLRAVGDEREPRTPATAPKWWEPLWRGMPEFVQEDLKPYRTLEVRLAPASAGSYSPMESLVVPKDHTIYVHFADNEAAQEFGKLIGRDALPDYVQSTTLPLTRPEFEALAGQVYHHKWLWYPGQEYGSWKSHYVGGPNPRYPVYVISKGRWEARTTARYLDRMGVPYRIVVEPQERDAYAAGLDPDKILVLPFSNLGQGSVPARNWVWEHSLSEGAERHWILDDNIQGFTRLHRNVKRFVMSGASFRAIEDWVDRYENIALAGMQYEFFASRRSVWPPIYLNTRVYSCILIQNSLPFRWRGRYNEDTDLSLRALKAGFCTALFYAFLAKKATTMTMKGGNTDELYAGDGRLKMAESLRDQHPDVTKIVHKWGRWQHTVNYEPFKDNRLRMKSDVEIPDGVNDYGMVLTDDEMPPLPK